MCTGVSFSTHLVSMVYLFFNLSHLSYINEESFQFNVILEKNGYFQMETVFYTNDQPRLINT